MEKYLTRWAEPESVALASELGCYHAALIVPALGEPVSLLDGYREAARHADGRVLVILVVNSNADCSREQQRLNSQLLENLILRGEAVRAESLLVKDPEFDVLVVDRASAGRELPLKKGVGLARKIGADIALALLARECLEQPIVYFTDADAELPKDYFHRCETGDSFAAWLFPFCHVSDGDSAVFEATLLYELTIRYHVLGLAFARSAYAYHSVGSTIAVAGASYAAVRGVPKRNAGEDFYLLDKLGKVGPLRRLTGAPVRLKSRQSWRVPFGTGPKVTKIMNEGDVSVTNPLAYEVLRRVLAALDGFEVRREVSVFDDVAAGLPPIAAEAARRAFNASGLSRAATDAASRTGQGDLRRRTHSWFDGLRTLRFLHALRDAGLADVPWQSAIASAPFARHAGDSRVSAVLTHLIELESKLAKDIGVSSLSTHGDI